MDVPCINIRMNCQAGRAPPPHPPPICHACREVWSLALINSQFLKRHVGSGDRVMRPAWDRFEFMSLSVIPQCPKIMPHSLGSPGFNNRDDTLAIYITPGRLRTRRRYCFYLDPRGRLLNHQSPIFRYQWGLGYAQEVVIG